MQHKHGEKNVEEGEKRPKIAERYFFRSLPVVASKCSSLSCAFPNMNLKWLFSFPFYAPVSQALTLIVALILNLPVAVQRQVL